MKQPSILLGFSGGIDSCASARWLIERGYRVTALTIDTMHDQRLLSQAEAKAREIGIEWRTVDLTAEFRHHIVDYFIDSYRNGLTPAPCTRCNPMIKWRTLLAVANELNIDYLATGHYFRIEQHRGRYYVAKGADSAKDQSYYLWGLGQEILARAITPMADAIKSDIKAGLKDRSESMGICFLQRCHYTEFLRNEGVELAAGDIILEDGKVVGRHNGIARYTIGQRRGEGIPEGLRIIDIDANRNTLTVGENSKLYKNILYIKECCIVDHDELITADDITIKIRGIGRNPEGCARVSIWNDGYRIECQDPAWAPAKGQPLVLYRNNLVIGGGIVVDFE